jgi:hypothetical protein
MLSERRVAAPDGALNVASGPENGPPLLFLHGVGRLWQDFLPLVPRFACRWQIFAVDFRGHGQSDFAPGKYLVTDYVRDALFVAREVIGKPLVVYGHSLGRIADCTHVRVAGGGHLVHSLRTETTLRLVGDFLESIALDPGSQPGAPRPK